MLDNIDSDLFILVSNLLAGIYFSVVILHINWASYGDETILIFAHRSVWTLR